jgi:hypothetical protein
MQALVAAVYTDVQFGLSSGYVLVATISVLERAYALICYVHVHTPYIHVCCSSVSNDTHAHTPFVTHCVLLCTQIHALCITVQLAAALCIKSHACTHTTV